MKKIIPLILLLLVWIASTTAQQDTGVRAQANDLVNMRAQPGTDYEIVGQMAVGVPYAVVGRSEFYPWLLVADAVTLQPVGWVFQDIVTITGNINSLPISTAVVSAIPIQATPMAITVTATQSNLNVPATQASVATETPTFTVAGTTKGEVNVRYGPGVDYPRIGIAQAGERFQIVAWHTQLPWVQIRYETSPTGLAWIAIDLLDIVGDIYSLPSISSTIFNLPTLTPTPSVIQSSNRLSTSGVTISPEFAALGDRLWQTALALGFDPQTSQFGSLYMMDLQTGEALSYNGNVAYRGTSVNKISILVALYGVLDVPPNQTQATDIANTMICSENYATNRLIAIIGDGDEWLGAERITETLRQMGIENTFLLAPIAADPANPPIAPAPIPVPVTTADQIIAHPEPYSQMTVEDMGWLLASVYQCAYEERGPLIEQFPAGTYEPRECRQMIHVMANNNVDGLMKAGVPEGVRVAHKHGWVNDTHANAGIFFTDGGDYVITMAAHSSQLDSQGDRYLAFPSTLPLFAETSRQVYNYFNPTNPALGIRDGFIPDALTCNFAGTPLITDLMQMTWDQ